MKSESLEQFFKNDFVPYVRPELLVLCVQPVYTHGNPAVPRRQQLLSKSWQGWGGGAGGTTPQDSQVPLSEQQESTVWLRTWLWPQRNWNLTPLCP